MKQTLLFLSFIVFLASCKKDKLPVPPILIPTASINYNLLDSMKLDSFIKVYDPILYSNYNNKVYKLNTTKARGGYKQEGNDIIIWFEDTVYLNLESIIFITLKGKTLLNFAGTYTETDDVYYRWRQSLSANKWTMSMVDINMKKGKIIIEYNASTKTISGSVQGLQYEFGIHLPYYFSGSNVQPNETLSIHNGFRRHDITFSHVRSN